MEVSSVTLLGRHHCSPEGDTWSESGKPVETEENKVLIFNSSKGCSEQGTRAGGWGKERQKKKIEGEKQKCDWIRACGLKSNCLLLDPGSPPLGRQDVAWHLFPGFVRTMARGMGHFLALLSSPNLSTIYLSLVSLLLSCFPYSACGLIFSVLLLHSCCCPISHSRGW